MTKTSAVGSQRLLSSEDRLPKHFQGDNRMSQALSLVKTDWIEEDLILDEEFWVFVDKGNEPEER